MPEYLIRLFKKDGSLSLVAGLSAGSVADARREAKFLMELCHLERADIWTGERILARLDVVAPCANPGTADRCGRGMGRH